MIVSFSRIESVTKCACFLVAAMIGGCAAHDPVVTRTCTHTCDIATIVLQTVEMQVDAQGPACVVELSFANNSRSDWSVVTPLLEHHVASNLRFYRMGTQDIYALACEYPAGYVPPGYPAKKLVPMGQARRFRFYMPLAVSSGVIAHSGGEGAEPMPLMPGTYAVDVMCRPASERICDEEGDRKLVVTCSNKLWYKELEPATQ